MVIVGGEFELEPSQREAFIASRADLMRESRAEHGCIEYTFAADPLNPARVVLFERWEDQAALDAHLVIRRGSQPPAGDVAPISSSIVIYTVSGEHRLA